MCSRRELSFAVASIVLGFGISRSAAAGVSFEVYTDRAAFEARIAGAGTLRTVDFDDVDTATVDPVTISGARYRSSSGATIVADTPQVSRSFGAPVALPPVSPPNVYRAASNDTVVYFWVGFEITSVTAVGVTFVGDYPADGPSNLHVRNGNGSIHFETPTVTGSGPHLFRGVVAIDDDSNLPTPVIFEMRITAGPGYPEPPGEHALDDLVFTAPEPAIRGEICDNCIDDDGDSFVDRADGECDAPADGGERGLGDPALGKQMSKCQKASAKSGAAFVAAMQKQLHGCAGAVLQCLQLKPADAACLPKAVTKCAKASTKIDALGDKLRASVGKSCGSLSELGVMSLQGLGYSGQYVECLRYGVTLHTAADLGECVVRQHRCRAEQLVSAENARAIELAKLGQLDLANGFACLEPGADGNQTGLGDGARGKAALKCQKAIAKAGITYAGKRQKQIAKCYDLLTACLQLKPDDSTCREKALGKCETLFEPVWSALDDPKGLAGKARATIVKGCVAVPLADLFSPEGLGQGALATTCQLLQSGSTFASITDVADCLVVQHDCRVDRLLEQQYPRMFELNWIFD